MSTELLQQSAIHEAGHIIMAHYFGHSINFTSIDKEIPGEGKTSISWGTDQPLINILTKPALIADRQKLQNIDKEYLIGLANQFIMVLCAGTAAEAVYETQNSGSTSITSLNGSDNDTIADFIDALSSIGITLPDDVVLKNYQMVFGFLSKSAFSAAIMELSDKIVSATNHQLNAAELKEFFSNISLG